MHKTPKSSLIKIVKLNKKGNGIGIISSPNGNPLQIEVPFTLPQELVKVEVIKRKKGGIGLLQEIVQPSLFRQEPLCKHFGECGGCRFQNLSYDQQLKLKEEQVLSLFKPYFSGQGEILPILGCEDTFHYRNKMEFSFSEDVKGNKFLGLIKDLSKGRVVSLEECHLVSPWFIKALSSVRDWWENTGLSAYSSTRGIGSLRTLILREGIHTGDRMAILTISGDPEYALNKKDLEKFVDALNKTFDPKSLSLKSVFLRIQQAAKGVETNFFEIHLFGTDHIREILKIKIQNLEKPQHFSFHISPTAFFQPNTLQAERLYEEALSMAEISPEDIVYDLYCGTGTLGIVAAKQAKQVIGIEISPESILDAKTNAEINGIKNIEFFTGAVRNVLATMPQKSFPYPDIVVLDPPRPGLDPEALRYLIDLSPPKIIYISCNPLTQLQNVKSFLDQGYKIISMRLIDQFPHTPHVENIILLKKVSS